MSVTVEESDLRIEKRNRRVLPDVCRFHPRTRILFLDCPNAVVARILFYLGQAEHLHDWRNIHCETASETFLQAVPAADWIPGGPGPTFNGTVGSRLLFVRAAKQHPISVCNEHCPEIFQAAQVVSKLCRSHLNHKGGRIGRWILVGLKFRSSRRCLQSPWTFFRPDDRHKYLPSFTCELDIC